jgi:hypothetical protein
MPKIIEHVMDLVQDPYGNYAITEIISVSIRLRAQIAVFYLI